jgi:hypothetical protein
MLAADGVCDNGPCPPLQPSAVRRHAEMVRPQDRDQRDTTTLEAVCRSNDRRLDYSSSAAAIMRLSGGPIPDFRCRNLDIVISVTPAM